MVSLAVLQLTAEFSSRQGCQMPASIDEKLGVFDGMVLGEPVEERRCRIKKFERANAEAAQRLSETGLKPKEPIS